MNSFLCFVIEIQNSVAWTERARTHDGKVSSNSFDFISPAAEEQHNGNVTVKGEVCFLHTEPYSKDIYNHIQVQQHYFDE